MSSFNWTDWNFLAPVRNWYARFERPISSLSLIGGFLFDIVTLHRVDMFWENFWVFAHLVIVGVCIILINRNDLKMGDEANPSKAHFWYVNTLQFFFGGILSTYLVFYFRSGSLVVSWPFILILGFAFWANESFKRQYVRISFQVVLLYLSIFAFTIFLIPVLIHRMGPWVFLLSGGISLVCMWAFLITLALATRGKIRRERKVILISVGCVFVLVNMLYFLNLIPPIPLSLKDSGVYHTLDKRADGGYVVQTESAHWWNFFIVYDDFHVSGDAPVYVYNAIFSPPQLNLTIVHHYQYYDTVAEKWIEEGTVPLSVLGGRDTGFRTYSVRSGLTPGSWRVKVETQSGQVIGIVRFTIVRDGTVPVLVTEVK